jgi:hypothetical protein
LAVLVYNIERGEITFRQFWDILLGIVRIDSPGIYYWEGRDVRFGSSGNYILEGRDVWFGCSGI